MSIMKITKVALTLSLLLAQLTKADYAVQCSYIDDRSLNRNGDYELYEACDGECECYAFELLCLQRNDAYFTLVPKTFDEAIACPVTKCLCNYDEEAWETTANVNNGVALPKMRFHSLPPFSEAIE